MEANIQRGKEKHTKKKNIVKISKAQPISQMDFTFLLSENN